MLGLVSGYIGGITDRIISLVVDAMYAFPGLILAIAVAALLGVGIINMALAIAVVYIPSYYRMIRGIVLSIKAMPYIEAVKAMGAGSLKTLFRHILPNIIYSAIAVLPINFADSIITEAGLSFLGLGISPPTPDWGFDLNTGQRFFTSGYWWIGAFPGMMIVITVLGFLLIGEGLNEILNPRRANK
jgi:peptide/nickel transport system permease protein